MADEPAPPTDDEPVVRLPRGKGLTLDRGMMFRIAMTLALLVMIVVAARPCANATSKFVTDFGTTGSGSAETAMPKPGNVDEAVQPIEYEQLRPGMTDDEVKAAIERSKQRNGIRSGSGSASDSGSADGSGSATVGSGSAAPSP